MSAKKVRVDRWQCTCEKCHEQWQSKTEDKPRICPYCKTPNWEGKKK